jgi:hypothetical protein
MNINELPKEKGSGRPLGPLEELYWFYGRATPFHFALCAEIEGRTELPEWRMGLKVLQQKRPISTMGVGRNSAGSLSFLQQSHDIPLRVVTHPAARWQEEIAAELADPFDESAAPLLRVVLLHQADRSIVILVADHSILDGISMAHILHDLLRIMNGDAIEAQELSLPFEAFAGMPQILWGQREKQVEAGAELRTSLSLRRRGSIPMVQELQFSSTTTERLLEAARKHQTTLQGALCASLVFAGRRNSEAWRDLTLRLLVPISLRGVVGLSNDSVLALGVGILHALPDDPLNLWEMAVVLMDELRQYRTPEMLEMAGKMIAKLAQQGLNASRAAEFMIANFTSEGMVTNLGRLGFETTVGRFRIDRLWGPAVLTGVDGEQAIGAATVNGTLCLTHTSVSPFPDLLQTIETVLLQAI